MKRKYLAFDIETAKTQSADARDWKTERPLGISCAATFVADSGKPMLWYGITRGGRPANRMSQQEAGELVEHLMSQVRHGYTVVTWNGVSFDFDILAEESRMVEECRGLARNHVEMMFNILCQLGYGVSLDSAAKGMGLSGKHEGTSGAVVPRLWAEGRRQEVLDYVAQDVRIILELANMFEARGHLRWITRGGRKREMLLPRGWLSVNSAARLPQPATAWMSHQWSRRAFTAWMR
jgi:hypothetical protein